MSQLASGLAGQQNKGGIAPHRGRILVVDDEANALSALVDWLGEEGYDVEGASSGEEALEQLDRFGPEAVLTDLHMPGMTGFDLIEAGRDQCPECVFVVMTAYPSSHTQMDAARRGAHAYLTKPLELERVSNAIEEAIAHARRPAC